MGALHRAWEVMRGFLVHQPRYSNLQNGTSFRSRKCFWIIFCHILPNSPPNPIGASMGRHLSFFRSPKHTFELHDSFMVLGERMLSNLKLQGPQIFRFHIPLVTTKNKNSNPISLHPPYQAKMTSYTLNALCRRLSERALWGTSSQPCSYQGRAT